MKVILSRFELLTFRLGGGRSIQLSYRISSIRYDNIAFFQYKYKGFYSGFASSLRFFNMVNRKRYLGWLSKECYLNFNALPFHIDVQNPAF